MTTAVETPASAGPAWHAKRTTNLALDQWVVCILVGLLIIPVSEIRKLIVKTPIDEAPSEAAPGAAAVTAA